MTTEAIRDRSKTVTRRDGWWFLCVGEVLNAVRKAMGLKKGEHIERLDRIRVRSTRPEMLGWLLETNGPHYTYEQACEEVAREGFPGEEPAWFVEFYLRDRSLGYEELRKKAGSKRVNRIEFEYLEPQP